MSGLVSHDFVIDRQTRVYGEKELSKETALEY
jgi:hypothetical protein